MNRKSVVLVLLLLICVSIPALADIDLNFMVGFDGCFRPGEWTPITIWGTSDESLSGQLVVELSTATGSPAQYTQPASIQDVPVPQTVNVLMPYYGLNTIAVKFIADGRIKAEFNIRGPFTPLDPDTPLILHATQNPGGLSFLKKKALGLAHSSSGLSPAMRRQEAGKNKVNYERPPEPSG